MSVMPVMPRDHDWTVDDLDQLPDDGLQYELLDGILLVTPAPRPRHQDMVGELHLLLRQACPPGLKVYLSPIDWQPDRRTSLQPDLLVVDPALVDLDEPLRGHLRLAVEVLSPSTRRKDLVVKRSKYEDEGVTSYWMIDPDPEKPSVLVCELRGGRYVEVATVTRDEELSLDLPFPVTLRPSVLARG